MNKHSQETTIIFIDTTKSLSRGIIFYCPVIVIELLP